MNDKIVIIRNDLKNKIISDYKISGIIVVILLSKETEQKFTLKNNLYLFCSDVIDSHFQNSESYWKQAKYVRI